MRGFGVLLTKELREQWRTMRLPVALAVFAFIGIASPLVARYMSQIVTAIGGAQFNSLIPAPTIADSYVQFAKNASQIGAALAVILAMGSVSAERDRGTLAFLLSKPVSRAAVLLAKLTALAITITAGVLLAAGLAYLYTTVLFDTPGPGFAVFCAVTLLGLLVFSSLTFAVSTLTRSTIAAGGVGFILLIVLGAVSAIPNVGQYTPSGMLAVAAGAVRSGAFGPLAGPALVQLALVGAGYLAALVALQRQEV